MIANDGLSFLLSLAVGIGATAAAAETAAWNQNRGTHDTQTLEILRVNSGADHLCGAMQTGGGDAMQPCSTEVLMGAEWVVEDIDRRGIIDNSHLTLNFTDGRVAGSAGCNNYFAAFNVNEAGMKFGPAGATMKMCPEALMMQERRFLQALAKVDRFAISKDGALLLMAGERPVITARR